jgi:fibronectin type 3 domain-containing protein
VRLQWSGTAPSWRIYRQGPGQERPEFLGESATPGYLDATARVGQEYRYQVQGRRDKTESEISDPVTIIPKDEFAPATPVGLSATASVSTIELAWDRNTESDLRGYKIYRAAGDGRFERIAELVETPTYSDRQIEAGKRYRYAVTAFDTANNESPRSAIVEATAP